MVKRGLLAAVLAVLGVCVGAGAVWAQADPYAAEYCEPEAQTKLLYSNRGYLILPKAPDSPALYFSYQILGTDKFVQRRGQFLFDDGDDRWKLETNPEALKLFWPLRPEKKLELERVDRTNGAQARVTFTVIGLEPIEVNHRPYKSFKIRRLDSFEGGSTFIQFLWYSPELCTLTQFTDSQHRTIRLLRLLKPSDADYGRDVVRRKSDLFFTDTNEMVK